MEARSISRRPHYYQRRTKSVAIGGSRRDGRRREVPAWEKRFCLVVGRMRWRDFLSCKEQVSCKGSCYFDRIMRWWDDSAAYECFRDAKARFYAGNYYSDDHRQRRVPPGPDVYIDDVVWRAPNDEDWELRWLVAEAEEAQEREMELAAARNNYIYSWMIPLEEIKATGWDDDVVDLTGMVIGGSDV